MSAAREPRDGAAVRFPPPLVFALAIGAGVLLGRGPVPLTIAASTTALAIGWLLVGAGLAVAGAALLAFLGTGQNPEPWTPTPAIVTTGVYRLTRNPMYLGMALCQLGLGLLLGNGWLLLLTPLAMAAVERIAIRPEETYLAGKFGAPYRAYRDRVRRWL